MDSTRGLHGVIPGFPRYRPHYRSPIKRFQNVISRFSAQLPDRIILVDEDSDKERPPPPPPDPPPVPLPKSATNGVSGCFTNTHAVLHRPRRKTRLPNLGSTFAVNLFSCVSCTPRERCTLRESTIIARANQIHQAKILIPGHSCGTAAKRSSLYR